tara:strand:+ start:766 stop:1143 length:378 start_codon:yes stop_codon:yes gene_type:complete
MADFQDLFATTWKRFYTGDIPPGSDSLTLKFYKDNKITFEYDRNKIQDGVPYGKNLRIIYNTFYNGAIVKGNISLAHDDDASEIEEARKAIEYFGYKMPQSRSFSNGPKFGNMNMIAGFSGYEFK